MKHLLNGVAIAAALTIAAPAWAQAPMTPGAPKAPAAAAAPAPAAGAPMKATKAGKQRHHRMMRHAARHGKMKNAGDQMTQQLNREELARIQGGMAPPSAPPAPQALQGPKASGSTKTP